MRSKRILSPVLAIALVAGLFGATSPAIADEAKAPSTSAESPAPKLELDPQWDYWSTAWLSTSATQTDLDHVVNSANALRTMQLTVGRPPAEIKEKDVETYTELRLFDLGQLGSEMAIGEVSEVRGFANDGVLSSVCIDGTISAPKSPDGDVRSVRCRLDPNKWPSTAPQDASSTDVSTPSPQQGLVGRAESTDSSELVLPIAIGASAQGMLDPLGEARAKNLEKWLDRIRGDKPLPSPGPGSRSITQPMDLKSAIRLVRVRKVLPSRGHQDTKYYEDVLTETDLKWEQCLARSGTGFLRRYGCRPDTRYGLDLAGDGTRNGKASSEGGLPSSTTSNEAFGALNPGTTWRGSVKLTNGSQLRGWPGLSPFTQRGSANSDLYRGQQTAYVFSDWAPPGITNVRFTTGDKPKLHSGDCRQPPVDGATNQPNSVRADWPAAIREAGTICAIGQQEDPSLQPLLFPRSFNGGQPRWTPAKGSMGATTWDVSYDVPADYLRVAANDPTNWKLQEREITELSYTDDQGQQLTTPVEKKSTVSEYISTSAPQAWAWVPAGCTDVSRMGYVCAANAAPNPTDEAPQNLELVQIGNAGSFERSICASCWPTPATTGMDWSNADASKTASSEADSNIMAGQSGYLTVAGVNESQTPGNWHELKVIVNGVPDNVTVSAHSVAKLPTDGSEVAWVPNVKNELITCSPPDSGRVVCSFTNQAGVNTTLGKHWATGQYAVMLKVDVGLDAPTSADDSAYLLKAHYEYPHYLNGSPALGGSDAQSIELKILPQAEAVVSLRSQVPGVDQAGKPKPGRWSNLTGAPLKLKPASGSELRYSVTNAGQRWIRPGDQLRISATLPAGISVAPDQVRNDYESQFKKELQQFGEAWTCTTTAAASQQQELYGMALTWDRTQLDCQATVSSKRTDGLVAGTGVNAEFPALIVPITAGMELPQTAMSIEASTSVWRPKASDFAQISAPDNANGSSSLPIEVDGGGTAPTVTGYWLMRPVSGGKATVRLDVGNVSPADTKTITLNVDSSVGTQWSSATGAGWTCESDQGDDSPDRLSCQYTGTSSVAPLIVSYDVAQDAGAELQLSAAVGVLRVARPAAPGDSATTLTYPIGQAIRATATTPDANSIATSYVLAGSTDQPLSFDGPIKQPQKRATSAELDASGSIGPFQGQPYLVRWTQLCIEGVADGRDCAQRAPAVALLPNAYVANPSFTVPDVAADTDFRFAVEISDPLLPQDSVPPLTAEQAATIPTVTPNSATGEVTIHVESTRAPTADQQPSATPEQQNPLATDLQPTPTAQADTVVPRDQVETPAVRVERSAAGPSSDSGVGEGSGSESGSGSQSESGSTALDPSDSPNSQPSVSTPDEPTDPAPPDLPEDKFCAKFDKPAKAAGVELKDEPQRSGQSCTSANGRVIIGNWLEIQSAKYEIAASGITIESGQIKLPDSWGLKKSKLAVTSPLIIPFDDRELKGKLELSTLPFPQIFGQFGNFTNNKLTLTFDEGSTELKLTAAQADPNDTTVVLAGTVNKKGGYKLHAELANFITFPNDVRLGVAGELHADDPTATTQWELIGTVGNIKFSNQVVISELKVTANAKHVDIAAQALIGKADQNPIAVQVSGSMREGLIKLNGKVANLQWAQLPGYSFAVEAAVSYDIDYKDFSVTANLSGTGASGDSNSAVRVADPKISISGTQLPADQSEVDVSVSAKAQFLVAGAQPNKPLKLNAQGAVRLNQGGASISLGAYQDSISFEMVKGIFADDLSFAIAYDATAPAGSRVNASVAGTITATVPSPGNDTTVTAGIKGTYLPAGVDFTGSWQQESWNLGEGIAMTGLQFAYRSPGLAGDLQPSLPGLPILKNFSGLAVLGTHTTKPGEFLYETLGLRGQLSGYARLDLSSGSFEAAIRSDGQLQVFGQPGNGKANLAIDQPYLQLTYTAEQAEAPRQLTVALGGTGTLEYPGADGGLTKLDGLKTGAAVDLSNSDFSGSLALSKTWTDAGGIRGLSVNEAEIELDARKTANGTKLSASFRALLGQSDQAPDFLNKLGLSKDATVAVGFGLGENWCARLGIAGKNADSVALTPFSFAGESAAKALTVSSAEFVAATGECTIGTDTVDHSAMLVKGEILDGIPVEIDLEADRAGDDIKLTSSADEPTQVQAAPVGPATIENATIDVALDTAAKGEIGSDANAIGVKGSLPLGESKLSVAGSVGQADASLVLDLTADYSAGTPLTLGALELSEAKVAAKITVGASAKASGFAMDINGKMLVAKQPLDVTLGVHYAGGSVTAVKGVVGSNEGVAIGNNVVVAGTGTVEWSDADGLDVSFGTHDETSSGTTLLVCPQGNESYEEQGVKKARCIGSGYGLEHARVDVGDDGFTASATINLGALATGRVSGAYYASSTTALDPGYIDIGPKRYLAQAGDFAFAVEDAVINLPSGATSGSIALARYTDLNGPQLRGRLAFQTELMGAGVSFDGDYDTSGGYSIEADVGAYQLGGYQLHRGKLKVTNLDAQRNRVDPVIDVNVDVEALNFGRLALAGRYGTEDGSFGYRLDGNLILALPSGNARAHVIYSSYPRDAGYGFEFALTLQDIGVQFGGVFRKVNGETLYRASGAVQIPIEPGISALGIARIDNCVDRDGYSCVVPRKVGNTTTPLVMVGAAVDVGGGMASVAVAGNIRFDGAFRFVGSAYADARFGPWSFYKVIKAEAGFTMKIGVCLANAKAIHGSGEERMGCGPQADQQWLAGVSGVAWASVTLDLWLTSRQARVAAEVMAVAYPRYAKYCAQFSAFKYKLTFGTCPNPNEIPVIKPSITDSTWT